ncbi:MAG: tetratricopeptide repeat protein [Cyanobacteria bacterium J06581_3]
MQILHIDLRSVDDGYADLRYGWENLNAFESRRLPLAQIQDLIDEMERDYYVARPEDYVRTGNRLYAWLDGSDRWLAQLLEGARAGVVLAIATTERLAHLPWEVLHDGSSFLVARPFPVVVPVRWEAGRTGEALSWQEGKPPNRPLQALFMATSPAGVTPVLDFEAEEGRILAATKRQPMTLRVEESGCLAELENLLASYEAGHFDVVHLTGHALLGAEGPLFITESETGARVDASPQEIAAALQFRFPALMFLSGCRTGQSGRGGEVPSMAAALLGYGAGAVLGWGRPVLDTDGILAAEKLYAALAAAKTLPEALAKTYQAMIAAEARDWHLLRLYVRGVLPQGLVTPKSTPGRALEGSASMATEFLDAQENVKVPTRESFVGRRRPLQNCLRALQERAVPGVLLYGMGGLGKSSLAARICDRLDGFERVVWFGRLDEAELVNRLGDYVGREARLRLQDPQEDLKYRLRDLFAVDGGPVFLLVLDDFEVNLEGADFRLEVEVAKVLGALLWALEKAGRGHKVLMTCRYDFEFSGMVGFYKQPLAGLKDADLQKKCAQLKTFERGSGVEKGIRDRALGLADGNPRLLEWLDRVMQAQAVDLAGLLDTLKGERRIELREEVMAAALLAQVDEPMRKMLGRARVYELPVLGEAIVAVCEDVVDVKRLIGRAVSLGLLEQSPDGALRVPRVLPLTVVEDDGLVARAAAVLYRIWWEEAESSSEAQRLEIHRLALLGKKKVIVSDVTTSLTAQWNASSRFRETAQLCEKVLTLTSDHRILYNFARAQKELGHVVSAAEQCNKALEICSEEDETWKAILHQIAALKSQKGDVEDAIKLYKESLAISQQIDDAQGKAATLHQIACLKVQKGDVEDAIKLYEESLVIKEQNGNVRGAANTLHQIAVIKAQQGNAEGAITLYEKSLAIEERIDNPQGKAATLHCLAILKARQGDTEGATTLYKKSLAIKEQIGDARGKAATLHCLAILKARQGDTEGATTLYKKSLAIAEKSDDAQGRAANLHQIAGLKEQQGDVEGAITLYEESLRIQEQLGNAQGKATTLAMLGQLLSEKKGDIKTAISYLQESLTTLQRIGSPSAQSVQDMIDRITSGGE